MNRRINIMIVVAFVLLVSILGFLVVRGTPEPEPTTKLPTEQLIERIAESNPHFTIYEDETNCAPVLRQYYATRSIYKGKEMTPTLESNIYYLFAGWLDYENLPTKEQVTELIAYCEEQD